MEQRYANFPRQVHGILDDCLYNIISDTVLKVHREEKILRMQTVAIQAEKARDRAESDASESNEAYGSKSEGAIIQDGKTYLQGNPLRQTTEILCPTCRLPRLHHPTTGRRSKPPEPGKDYCAKQPYIEKPGCDIYGKSLSLEKPSKKSKANKDAKKQAEHSDGSDSEKGSPTRGKNSDVPAATSVPSAKCPNCPRYIAYTRIAQHMERCLYTGRASTNKTAVNKLSLGSNTPRDSRAGTPKPPVPGSSANNKKRKLENKGTDDDTEEALGAQTLAKKKKVSAPKKSGEGVKKENGKEKALNSNLQRVKVAEKRLPGQPATGEGIGKEKDVDMTESSQEKAPKQEGDDLFFYV